MLGGLPLSLVLVGLNILLFFVDDYSHYSLIFHMKHRSELLQVYSNFAKMVEAQYAFQAILHSYGTVHHLTCPVTFQQNGRAE